MEWAALVIVLFGVFTFVPGLKDHNISSSARQETCVSKQSADAAAEVKKPGTIYRDLTVADSRRVVVESRPGEAPCQDD